MKRIIAFMLVAACLLFSSSCAESSLFLNCKIAGSFDTKAITVKWMADDGQPAVLCSVCPEHVFQLDPLFSSIISSDKPFRFFNARHLHQGVLRVEELFFSWLINQPSTLSKGLFSGELFESASVRNSSEFLLADFNRYLQGELYKYRQKRDLNDSDQAYIMMIYAFARMCQSGGDDILLVQANQFDGGRFVTMNIMRENKTVMTLSVDLSGQNTRTMICMLKEKDYCRIIETVYVYSGEQISLQTKHYLSSDASYHAVNSLKPLYMTKIDIKALNDDKNEFLYTFEADNLTNPFTVTAEISKDSITAKGSIADYEQLCFDFELSAVNNISENVLKNKEVISTDNPEERNHACQLVWTGMIPILTEIIPYLPDGYRKLITSFIYQ